MRLDPESVRGCSGKFSAFRLASNRKIVESNNVIEETELRTSIADVAAMARYNAFRCSYSELNGCSLLINIGAHTTNLLFIDPERLFSRMFQLAMSCGARYNESDGFCDGNPSAFGRV